MSKTIELGGATNYAFDVTVGSLTGQHFQDLAMIWMVSGASSPLVVQWGWDQKALRYYQHSAPWKCANGTTAGEPNQTCPAGTLVALEPSTVHVSVDGNTVVVTVNGTEALRGDFTGVDMAEQIQITVSNGSLVVSDLETSSGLPVWAWVLIGLGIFLLVVAIGYGIYAATRPAPAPAPAPTKTKVVVTPPRPAPSPYPTSVYPPGVYPPMAYPGPYPAGATPPLGAPVGYPSYPSVGYPPAPMPATYVPPTAAAPLSVPAPAGVYMG